MKKVYNYNPEEARTRRRQQNLKYMRRRYRANKDRLLKWQHEYYREHRDERSEWQLQYYEQHRSEHIRKVKEYDRKRPEVHRVIANRRRVSTKEGDLTVMQWEELVEECGGMCVICHAPYEHMDHIIPLSKGGKHTLSNVQPLCAECNQKKGNR